MRVLGAGGMRVDYTVQRRRRKKAAPKNIFGATSQTSSKAKSGSISKPKSPKPRSPRAAPPSAPGSRPKPVAKPKPSTISKIKQAKQTDSVEAKGQSDVAQITEPEETILESQMLGVQKGGVASQDNKSTMSEKKTAEIIHKVEPKIEDSGTSLKARQIIEDSILRASLAAEKEKTSSVSKKSPSETKTEPKKPQKNSVARHHHINLPTVLEDWIEADTWSTSMRCGAPCRNWRLRGVSFKSLSDNMGQR